MLHATLTTADAIAAYLQDKAHKEVLTDPKTLQTFIGATLSGRSEDVFSSLVSDFKHEVFQLLFSLYSLCTTGKMVLRPPSHEFLIRCEQHGVRRPEWEAALTAAHGVDTSLLTPKAMLKRLAQVEPVGRLQRLMEMSTSPEDLRKCALKLKKMVEGTEEGEEGPQEGSSAAATKTPPGSVAALRARGKTTAAARKSGNLFLTEDSAYAQKCQLLSKLVSKMRRVAAGSVKSANEDGNAVDVEKEEEIVAQDENNEEENGEHEGDVPKQDDAKIHWSSEEQLVIRESFSIITSILDALMKEKPTSSTLHPVGKLLKCAEWALPLELISEKDAKHIKALDDATQESLQQTADQMEIVMRLKALPEGDSTALETLLNELWSDSTQCFAPSSSDVLSSIATAAERKGMDEVLQRETARRLTATQTTLKASGSSQVLPRRALRFVHANLQKEKQAEVAKHIQSLAQQ